MAITFRSVEASELGQFVRAVGAGFGEAVSDAEVTDWSSLTEVDRTVAGFDGDQIVATGGALSLHLTLPGGTAVPACGITAITVHPTHRRRGALREMMGRLLDQAEARREPVAILTASESDIYGRFGFGVAALSARIAVDTEHAEFANGAALDGRFRLVDEKTARAVFPAVFDAHRLRQPGDITRSDAFWDVWARDAEHMRDGDGPAFRVLHEDRNGLPDGYAEYRYTRKWVDGNPAKEVMVTDVSASSDEVEAGLFRFLFDLDLVSVVRADRPVEDHLRWRLAAPRHYRTERVVDELWIRVLDVSASLSARRYRNPVDLVLEVVDHFRPGSGGAFRLVVDGAGVGQCERADADADLVVPVDALGVALLGGARWATLAAAGRVVERRAGALREADAAFADERSPFLRTGF